MVIKGDETVKIMSLFDLTKDGTNSADHNAKMSLGIEGITNTTDENDGKANSTTLVSLGSDYKAAVAC